LRSIYFSFVFGCAMKRPMGLVRHKKQQKIQQRHKKTAKATAKETATA
jgi:hypothetical protein